MQKRETMNLCELIGDEKQLNESKQELGKYLKSKEFNKSVKALDKGEQRLLLLSEDKDYTELLSSQL